MNNKKSDLLFLAVLYVRPCLILKYFVMPKQTRKFSSTRYIESNTGESTR